MMAASSADPRGGTRARSRLLAAAAAVLPVVAMYGAKLEVAVAVPVLLGLGVLGLRERRVLGRFPAWLALLLGAVAIWAAASWGWSVDPPRTAAKIPSLMAVLAGVVALFWVDRGLDPPARRVVALGLALGLALALALALLDLMLDAAIIRHLRVPRGASNEDLYSLFNRGLAVAAILVWPALLGLSRERRWGWALGAAALATAWLFHGTAVALSLTLGVAVCAAVWVLPRRAVTLVAAGAALWVLVAPLALHVLTTRVDVRHFLNIADVVSVPHRFVIWQFASAHVARRPLTGYGLGASRSVPGADERVALAGATGSVIGARLPVHPHNAPLQWWLELGLPMAVLGAAFMWQLFSLAGRIGERRARALVAGEIVTGYGISNLSFGAWQSWWLVALALAALFTVIQLPAAKKS